MGLYQPHHFCVLEITWQRWVTFKKSRETAELKRTDEGSTETAELPTCCSDPPPLLFQHGCSVFSQLTLRLVTESILPFCASYLFGVHHLRSDAKHTLLPAVKFSLSGVTFTNHSLQLGLFLSPKQLTTVFSAMVWVGTLSCPLHEQCVKTAPSWWRF